MHFHDIAESVLKDLFEVLDHHSVRVNKQLLPVSEPERAIELTSIAVKAISNDVVDLKLKLLELERKVNGNP